MYDTWRAILVAPSYFIQAESSSSSYIFQKIVKWPNFPFPCFSDFTFDLKFLRTINRKHANSDEFNTIIDLHFTKSFLAKL